MRRICVVPSVTVHVWAKVHLFSSLLCVSACLKCVTHTHIHTYAHTHTHTHTYSHMAVQVKDLETVHAKVVDERNSLNERLAHSEMRVLHMRERDGELVVCSCSVHVGAMLAIAQRSPGDNKKAILWVMPSIVYVCVRVCV